MMQADSSSVLSALRAGACDTAPPPINVVHSLGGGGLLLQAGSLPEHALDALRSECRGTACDAIHMHATALFDPTTFGLLKQTNACEAHDTALLKLLDGYVLFAPKLNHQVLSIIKDSPLCLPSSANPAMAVPIAPNGARTVFYSIVTPPTARPEFPAFRMVFHDGYTEPHEISRFSMVDHAIAQVAAAIPLSVSPRIIMQSENLGTLLGQCLAGSDADLIKQTFLGLVRQAPDGDVYDAPIETSALIAQLLQLKNIKGQFSLARLRDGLLGYRTRKDGHKSFIFVANSDDFHADAPSTSDQSQVHVYKMQYKDPKPTGNRIFVNVQLNSNNTTQSPCPYGTPLICPGQHSVQNVLGIIEWAIRHSGRDHAGCGDFPHFCLAQAIQRSGAPEDETMHPVIQQATRELLIPPNKNPPTSPEGLLMSLLGNNNNNNNGGEDPRIMQQG